LLFAYFGKALQPRQRALSTTLRSEIVKKKQLVNLIGDERFRARNHFALAGGGSTTIPRRRVLQNYSGGNLGEEARINTDRRCVKIKKSCRTSWLQGLALFFRKPEADGIVGGVNEVLSGSQIPLCGLDARVAQEQLDLLQFATRHRHSAHGVGDRGARFRGTQTPPG